MDLDSRDRLPSDQSGDSLECWTEPQTVQPEPVKVADSSSGGCRQKSGKSVGGGEWQKQGKLAATVKTKGASKSYDDAGEGVHKRGVAKRPAAGSDNLGPK